MRIDTKQMIVVTVTAETDDDAQIVRTINGWLRDNKIATERRSETVGSVNRYEALLAAEDADRLLSYIGRSEASNVRMAYAPQAGDGAEVV